MPLPWPYSVRVRNCFGNIEKKIMKNFFTHDVRPIACNRPGHGSQRRNHWGTSVSNKIHIYTTSQAKIILPTTFNMSKPSPHLTPSLIFYSIPLCLYNSPCLMHESSSLRSARCTAPSNAESTSIFGHVPGLHPDSPEIRPVPAS